MRRVALRALGVAALLGAAACAGVATTTAPTTGGDRPVRIEANRTPLGLGGAELAPGVRYAGGLTLRGEALHGLSDLKVVADRAWVVSDFGNMIRFTLVHDDAGRLVGAEAAAARSLTGLDGTVLEDKAGADAEGLAILPDGRVLVAFERDHRIWSYGAGGEERPTIVAAPDVDLPENAGFEGLAPAEGGWLVLGEEGGGWLCAPTCAPFGDLAPADGYRFTGADADPSGKGWFVVERFYSPPLDMRARVRRLSAEGVLSEPLIELRPPASVDNFEGVAAVASASGTRLYLLSDDNDNPVQKTLLLAFDLAPLI
ncbi:esterase-like activity of phytase family protein [Brevundimonas bacteroides]|uniref:esterase-like activity of phytase family protein n=1 Tax=Brevundimonas bacteroides TaxID=74311 RepID=UPI0012EDE5E0|nr:esterase-like activity of phytase family protein [Brevundimonas bacteroides]